VTAFHLKMIEYPRNRLRRLITRQVPIREPRDLFNTLGKLMWCIVCIKLVALFVLFGVGVFVTTKYKRYTNEVDLDRLRNIWEVWVGSKGLVGILFAVLQSLLISYLIHVFRGIVLSQSETTNAVVARTVNDAFYTVS
jgi:hypothetical protein